jgi:hypothetical protein
MHHACRAGVMGGVSPVQIYVALHTCAPVSPRAYILTIVSFSYSCTARCGDMRVARRLLPAVQPTTNKDRVGENGGKGKAGWVGG